MSPAAHSIAEIDQYFENLNTRGPKNYQRQNSRQFHNSQTRNSSFPCEPFGKANVSFTNGCRSPKFNPGYPRPVNFVDLHSQNGWSSMQPVSPVHSQRRYQPQYSACQYSKPRKEFSNNVETRQPFARMPGNLQNPQIPLAGKFNPRKQLNYSRNNQKSYKHVDKLDSNQNQKEPPSASDVASNASDESSGQSENSLPRIIKPRKRRKKDRKPVEVETVEPLVVESVTPKPVKKPLNNLSSKPYTPPCDPPHINTNNISIQSTPAPPVQVPKLDTSKDDNAFSPFIADSFVNLILDEDASRNVEEKLFVKKDEEPSTVCQCRYCDPCGEIWDVEQRCYSPFLTPPSPNEPKLFINSIRSVVGSMAKSNGSSYLLRRSWSEPSESSLLTVRSRNKSDSYEPNNDLQVSSEIVTSPNGHRDIEIKFFSTAKRYPELHKHSVPYSPPVSPWKKDVRFGDLFSLPNTIRPINVAL